MYVQFFFFFSSIRRHTIWPRDWSSDVCSSDLKHNKIFYLLSSLFIMFFFKLRFLLLIFSSLFYLLFLEQLRSEERRVGKECSSCISRYTSKSKTYIKITIFITIITTSSTIQFH